MIGARAFMAASCTLMIFCACVSDSEPPNTVKSLANTNTVRPFTVPQPVTTPSPGIFGLLHAEVAGAVLDEHVELLERALVEQELDALAGGELAALVLRLDARRPAAQAGLLAALFQPVEDVLHAQPFGIPADYKAKAIPWVRMAPKLRVPLTPTFSPLKGEKEKEEVGLPSRARWGMKRP